MCHYQLILIFYIDTLCILTVIKSGKNIFTYAFVAVDQDYEVVAECRGDIRISPLQLPAPMAIVANGINVVKHQKLAKDNEVQAMVAICKFITEMIERARGKATLIGFNSNRFDLPYF